METAHRGDEVGAPGVQASKFERCFDRFRAGITKVSPGQAPRGYLDQLLEQVRAHIVVHDIGAGDQGFGLLPDRRDQPGMRVAQRGDTDAAGTIDIFLSRFIVETGAAAAYRD